MRFLYRDHVPPHFHASYGGHEASVEIETLELNEGSLPPRAMALVLEWAVLHREELRENWDRARLRQPLVPIRPLE
ncbi:MAG: DUF4160 domain-containing protein [bacterium]